MTVKAAHRTVALAPTLNPAAGAAILASLPISFASAERSVADIVVVDGHLPSWPEEVSAAADRQVMVVDPCPVRSAASPGPFLLDTPWGSNPVCAAAAEAFRAAAWQRLKCRSVIGSGSDLRHELLRLVCLSRAVGTVVGSLRVLAMAEGGLAAVGRAGDRAVDFGVTSTDALASTASVRALTTDGEVHVRIPAPATAAPAELVVTDTDGARLYPTLWESGHRATWRRILLDAREDDSGAFAADLALVIQAIARKETAQ